MAKPERRTPTVARKAFLEAVVRRSIQDGEKLPHPVRVSISSERQWDGRWFDVTLTSDGETISVASFRRVKDARVHRKRLIDALKIPGVDARPRSHRGRKRQFAAEMRQTSDT